MLGRSAFVIFRNRSLGVGAGNTGPRYKGNLPFPRQFSVSFADPHLAEGAKDMSRIRGGPGWGERGQPCCWIVERVAETLRPFLGVGPEVLGKLSGRDLLVKGMYLRSASHGDRSHFPGVEVARVHHDLHARIGSKPLTQPRVRPGEPPEHAVFEQKPDGANGGPIRAVGSYPRHQTLREEVRGVHAGHASPTCQVPRMLPLGCTYTDPAVGGSITEVLGRTAMLRGQVRIAHRRRSASKDLVESGRTVRDVAAALGARSPACADGSLPASSQ